jgi:hypothetical protein
MVSNRRVLVAIAGLIGVVQGQYLNTTTTSSADANIATPEGQWRGSSTCSAKTIYTTVPGGGGGYCPTQTVTSISVSVSTCTETKTEWSTQTQTAQ